MVRWEKEQRRLLHWLLIRLKTIAIELVVVRKILGWKSWVWKGLHEWHVLLVPS